MSSTFIRWIRTGFFLFRINRKLMISLQYNNSLVSHGSVVSPFSIVSSTLIIFVNNFFVFNWLSLPMRQWDYSIISLIYWYPPLPLLSLYPSPLFRSHLVIVVLNLVVVFFNWLEYGYTIVLVPYPLLYLMMRYFIISLHKCVSGREERRKEGISNCSGWEWRGIGIRAASTQGIDCIRPSHL